MKPLVKNVGQVDPSISNQFDKRLIWYRRFWNAYYMFQYSFELEEVTVYKNMYNPQHWQDEWTEIHTFHKGHR